MDVSLGEVLASMARANWLSNIFTSSEGININDTLGLELKYKCLRLADQFNLDPGEDCWVMGYHTTKKNPQSVIYRL